MRCVNCLEERGDIGNVERVCDKCVAIGYVATYMEDNRMTITNWADMVQEWTSEGLYDKAHRAHKSWQNREDFIFVVSSFWLKEGRYEQIEKEEQEKGTKKGLKVVD